MRMPQDEIYLPPAQGQWDSEASRLTPLTASDPAPVQGRPGEPVTLICVNVSANRFDCEFTLNGFYTGRPIWLGTALFYDVTDDNGDPWRVYHANFEPVPEPEDPPKTPLLLTLAGIAAFYFLIWLLVAFVPGWLPVSTD